MLHDFGMLFEFSGSPVRQAIPLALWRRLLIGIAVWMRMVRLTAGKTGTQLTWMDAKIGDWAVMARHDKPVEIPALVQSTACNGRLGSAMQA
jgi:hypothetical protein